MMVDTASSENELLDYAKNKHRKGLLAEANVIYTRILRRNPDSVEGLRLRAVIYLENGDTKNCHRLLNKALSLSPGNASVLNNLGSLLQSQKQFSEAIHLFKQALSIEPNFGAAANNLGNCFRSIGSLDKAIEAYSRALEIDNNLPQAWNNLGNALSQGQRVQDAEKCFLKALKLNPSFPEAWNNMGICYANTGRKEQALYAYNQAIKYDEGFSFAYNNKGNVYLKIYRFEQALECFELALKFNTQLAEAWNGCGCANRNLGKLKQAVKCLKKSIALDFDYAEAWNNIGLTYADQGLLDAALDAFKTALKIRPDYGACHSNLLFYLNYLHDLHERTLFETHEHWAVTHQKYPSELPNILVKPESSPLKLGFVSADFCRHPISYFILPIFRNLSTEKFQIYCYSNSPHEDDQTQKIKQLCENWRNVSSISDQKLVNTIREDEIDILFDLSGHTHGNRLTAFSLKPAPLQISWLGYPHTTGLEAIDVILSDKINSPEYIQWMYSEQVEHLPHAKYCYEAPAYAPSINDLPAMENGFITFGSFNNPVKFNTETFVLWSEILKQTKESILVLSWKTLSDPTTAQHIYTVFKKNSIPRSRIKLLGDTRNHQQVFVDYSNIDIALDTFPFTGGLTSCEAMWMGIPVPTMAAKRPASRQTASILAELGLDELISFDSDQYINTVVSLAQNIPKLQALRQSLRRKMQESALADGAKFTRGFENTIKKLYECLKTRNQDIGIIESPTKIS